MEPQEIQIRRAGLEDLETLKSLARETFVETFADQNSAEDMDKYIRERMSDEKLKQEILDPNSEFYFAESGGAAIGYLKVNTGAAQTEPQEANALEIERIYVLKRFHGKSAGQLLHEKALHLARAKGAEHVWLGVWQDNHRAIRFYEKNGFVRYGEHIFRLGEDAQIDVLMKRTL